MKIQYSSDLHLEFPINKKYLKANPIKPEGEILLLAGDIIPFTEIERENDFFNYLSDSSEYVSSEAKNYLIVIGINEYSKWPISNNAVADATAILTSEYKFDKAQVTMLLNENATRQNIYSALRKHIEIVTTKDNLLIFYSGHGYFDKSN